MTDRDFPPAGQGATEEPQADGDQGAKHSNRAPRGSRELAAFEGVLLFSRWLQLPLLVGLIFALIIFEIKFAEHLIATFRNLDELSREQALLVTLDLIDMVLIANLVVMVVISGYETFISQLHLKNEPNIPVWLRRSTAGQLKLRITTTILLISTIHLLHFYLDPAEIDPEKAQFMLTAQVVFVLTAGAFVLFNWVDRKALNDNHWNPRAASHRSSAQAPALPQERRSETSDKVSSAQMEAPGAPAPANLSAQPRPQNKERLAPTREDQPGD